MAHTGPARSLEKSRSSQLGSPSGPEALCTFLCHSASLSFYSKMSQNFQQYYMAATYSEQVSKKQVSTLTCTVATDN